MNLQTARAALWTLVGAVVLLGIFFFALGGVDPAEAEVMAILIVVLGVLWLIHFWRVRQVTGDIRMQRGDRERRGF
ncbi:MAG TPA: hypothetical protein VFY44_03710 [Thermoleophilaceae bacterium]|nr:hypothetical protein [Thermoleophilaceae bacterium]